MRSDQMRLDATAFGTAVSGATLGGGSAPINRAQIYLTVNDRSPPLRGIAVAIVSS